MTLRSTVRNIARTAVEEYYRLQYHLYADRPRGFIFQLGTMRSGSSLLTHILTSNPEITGIGETHLTYTRPADLLQLAINVHHSLRKPFLQRRYVLDKVLFANISCDGILHAPNCYFVFMLRDPLQTISSMIRAFPDWFTGQPLSRQDLLIQARQYFTRQMGWLAETALAIDDHTRSVFIDYDELLSHTREVFGLLEQVLALKVPLAEDYVTNRLSGFGPYGDHSPNILRGHIERDAAKRGARADVVHREELTDCYVAFDRCRRVLLEKCVILPPVARVGANA